MGERERGQEPDRRTETVRQDDLAVLLSELARELHAVENPDEALEEIVQAAISLIPGAQDGSVTDVIGRNLLQHKASSGELPQRVEALTSELNEGPCLDALAGRRTVLVPDLSQELRWPRFSPRAVALGARSMLSFALYVESDSLCALNLYSCEPDAFTEESAHVGRLFATHAAVAYAGAQRLENLQGAIETRDLIGQAVGLLMERYSIGSDRAFRTLIRFSQQTNRKLRDVAAEIVHDTEAGFRS